MESIQPDSIINIDCLEGLKALPDNYIQCCVTSPPYWRLRDYGVEGQLGQEPTFEQYVENLLAVFAEVRRVLRPDGLLWLNLGDSYWGSGRNAGGKSKRNSYLNPHCSSSCTIGHHQVFKSKDLIGLPWTVAFALRKDGWYLRQDIVWAKKNPTPESVKDCCTRAHEFIFMFSKSARYYYDRYAISTAPLNSTKQDPRIWNSGAFNRIKNYTNNAGSSKLLDNKSSGSFPIVYRKSGNNRKDKRLQAFDMRWAKRQEHWLYKGVNRRSVWSLKSSPFKGGHFAPFPPELPELCIKAGSRPGDIILDPFAGAGTTAVVAKALNRQYIGFELNPDYVRLAEKRIIENGNRYDK